MTDSIQTLRSQRDAVLERMKQIDHLRRGSLSRQFFKTRRNGKIIESGPYFVLQCSFKGKKCSQRVAAAAAEQVEKQSKISASSMNWPKSSSLVRIGSPSWNAWRVTVKKRP